MRTDVKPCSNFRRGFHGLRELLIPGLHRADVALYTTPVDDGEVKRRIHAARILRSMTQVEMDRRGAELGLDGQELGRTERGTLTLTPARAMVLCRVLEVPPRWFEESDLNVIVGLRDQRDADALDLLRQGLADLGLALPPSGGEETSGEGDKDQPDEAAEGGGA